MTEIAKMLGHVRNGSDAERTIVKCALESEFVSPSDESLLSDLRIGRPRLSQILNELKRAEVLVDKRKGRRRYFSINPLLRPHLIRIFCDDLKILIRRQARDVLFDMVPEVRARAMNQIYDLGMWCQQGGQFRGKLYSIGKAEIVGPIVGAAFDRSESLLGIPIENNWRMDFFSCLSFPTTGERCLIIVNFFKHADMLVDDLIPEVQQVHSDDLIPWNDGVPENMRLRDSEPGIPGLERLDRPQLNFGLIESLGSDSNILVTSLFLSNTDDLFSKDEVYYWLNVLVGETSLEEHLTRKYPDYKMEKIRMGKASIRRSVNNLVQLGTILEHPVNPKNPDGHKQYSLNKEDINVKLLEMHLDSSIADTPKESDESAVVRFVNPLMELPPLTGGSRLDAILPGKEEDTSKIIEEYALSADSGDGVAHDDLIGHCATHNINRGEAELVLDILVDDARLYEHAFGRFKHIEMPPLSGIERARDRARAPRLDIEYLSTLGDSQVRILEEALEREVSPSDEVLQRGLDVSRRRLSQLFNDMLKAGVLTVRRQGRSRLYRISEQARDHLYRPRKEEEEGEDFVRGRTDKSSLLKSMRWLDSIIESSDNVGYASDRPFEERIKEMFFKRNLVWVIGQSGVRYEFFIPSLMESKNSTPPNMTIDNGERLLTFKGRPDYPIYDNYASLVLLLLNDKESIDLVKRDRRKCRWSTEELKKLEPLLEHENTIQELADFANSINRSANSVATKISSMKSA